MAATIMVWTRDSTASIDPYFLLNFSSPLAFTPSPAAGTQPGSDLWLTASVTLHVTRMAFGELFIENICLRSCHQRSGPMACSEKVGVPGSHNAFHPSTLTCQEEARLV